MPYASALSFAGMRRGARLALPFGASSLIYGLAFGLLASQAGLSVVDATAMSALVFSGTAQVAVLQNWTHAATTDLIALFVTVLIVNVRYVLMGAALRPWLGRFGSVKSTLALLPLVDGSFAIATRERANGDEDAGVLVGASLMSYAGWVIATAAGFFIGQLVPAPRAIGLDFVVIAFCAASAAMMLTRHLDYWPVAAAIALVVAGEILAPGPWVVVGAGLAAAFVAAVRFSDSPPPGGEGSGVGGSPILPSVVPPLPASPTSWRSHAPHGRGEGATR